MSNIHQSRIAASGDKPSNVNRRKGGWVITAGLALAIGLLAAPSAHALTYVDILSEPSAPEIQQALDRGVDISVYFTVFNDRTGKNEWRVMEFPKQHSLNAARDLINAQLHDNKRLPPEKQHQITIGWRRR